MSATNPVTALILDLLGELKHEQNTPDFYITEYHRLQKENSDLSDAIKDILIELDNLRTLCAESEDAYRTQEAHSIDTIAGLKNEVSALRQQRDELKRYADGLKFTIGELQSKYAALKTGTNNEAYTAALQLKETRAKLDSAVKIANTLQSRLDAPPALIRSPIGALPLNADGLRRLLTHCEYLQRKMDGIEALAEALRPYNIALFDQSGRLLPPNDIIAMLFKHKSTSAANSWHYRGKPIEDYGVIAIPKSEFDDKTLPAHYSFIKKEIRLPYLALTPILVVNRDNNKSTVVFTY